LTIELRGPIPTELRRGMGDWVFGCDVCQQVCPWNRDVPASTEPAFAGSAERAYPDLPGLLTLDTATFRSRFKGTPLFRTRRSGLLRNAAIALGNWLTERQATDETARARSALRHALADHEPIVRGAAAWALGQAGHEAQSLQAALAGEADPQVRDELIAALSNNPTTATPQENR
ncbi:MAG TPA: HEAT repeat domain-containing protein, partial [bacterium]